MTTPTRRSARLAAVTLPAAAAALLLAACASGADTIASPRAGSITPLSSTQAAAPATALEAAIVDASGARIGFARIGEDATGRVHLLVHATGLTPGLHGMHLHAIGLCEAGFTSAGGHHNPTNREHGTENPLGFHRGDLPNLEVNAEGVGRLAVTLESVRVAELQDESGTAIVVHANQDDLRTNAGPSGPGNSGARVACGVLGGA